MTGRCGQAPDRLWTVVECLPGGGAIAWPAEDEANARALLAELAAPPDREVADGAEPRGQLVIIGEAA